MPQPLRLWIDGQCLQTPSRVRGIGRYVTDLIDAIATHRPEVELSISFNAAMMGEAIAARDHVRSWIRRENIHLWQGVAKKGEAVEGLTPRRRLSELAIAHHVACLAPDIALSASPVEGELWPVAPLLPNPVTSVPIASIFYDAIPHRFADRYLTTSLQQAYYARRIAAFAAFDVNLCISEFSRGESVSVAGNSNSVNISAAISSTTLALIEAGGPAYPPLQGQKFVLYVGALDWRKNVGALIAAFQLLPETLRKGLKLVIAGEQDVDRLRDTVRAWRQAGLPPDGLVPLGFVADADLVALYRGAAMLVQPSLMEGFGLTALEAMHLGTPVLGAATGALPEVIGDPELLFDPNAPQAIADRMARILGDSEFTARIVAAGRTRAETFTAKRVADTAVEALTAAVARRRASGLASTDIAAIRARTAAAARNIDVPPAEMATALAMAEPLSARAPLLVVDATVTIIEDHGTGIQRVVKKICANLPERLGEAEVLIGYCDWEQLWYGLKPVPGRAIPPFNRRTAERARFGPADTLLMLDSSWEFHNEGSPAVLAARARGTEVISCVYDLVPVKYPAFADPGMQVAFGQWLSTALSYSTGFVCISRAVADELHDLLVGIDFPRRVRIGYWRLGADFGTRPAASASPAAKPAGTRPTFLMVGTIEPRKGHGVALDAFEQLWAAGFDADLVIVGKEGWHNEYIVQRLRDHPEAGKRLRWEQRVSDDELQQLYARSDALIAASFAEGFGLPIVEARHFGKPIIASGIPVFREVTTGARSSHFFAVGSASALADAVRGFTAEAAAVGQGDAEEAPWASWSDSARELLDVVENGRWYRTYEPTEARLYPSIYDIGRTEMAGPLAPPERAARLELVEGPVPSGAGAELKYTVQVANLSSLVWSSRSAEGDKHDIVLAWRAAGDDLSAAPRPERRLRIPFVLPAGESLLMALRVPAELRQKGIAGLEIAMFQNGVGWFGTPLRVPV